MDELASADLEGVDALVASYAQRGAQPGIAYGVVAGGQLVHAGGLGAARNGGPVPDAGTVFRIASMTKSFTATMVLTLRDEGALGLDDLAEQYVPELKGWPPVTPDAQRVRIRHLLTMTAGFPTDDPWGDREQGTPLPEFAEFLAQGVSFAWAPGTRFEYSNLGYAILGRVISAVTGAPYADVIKARLLDPLGMSQTGYEADRFAPDVLAAGHRREGSGWAELPVAPYGAFAPMGGVFSSVHDLARWVSGFAGAWPPGDEGAGPPHPLARSSRREMQLPQVATGVRGPAPLAVPPAPGSYGFGLFIDEDPVWGRIVHHSGGYPGFGSNMRWHPATGIGVIALGNSTYAPVSQLAARLLTTVLGQRARRLAGPGAGPGAGHGYQGGSPHAERALALAPARAPWPATVAAREEIGQLMESWDDAAADKLFSGNVALDQPLAERRRRVGLIRERLGGLREDASRPAESDTPAHCRWWVAGDHGTAQVEIRLTPQRPPRVQSFILAVPPATGSPLARAVVQLIDFINNGAAAWPESLPAAPSLDTGLTVRRLRMAGVWAGSCRPGAFRAGDGSTSVTVELAGEFASLYLAVAVSGDGGLVQQAEVMLAG
ncbi:MAG TPA: serine hydrolase domain-containing protein [Streptosporangiaceae bacterium]|jgi:CubicO group peptidase (beta-lactamase class C family)